MRFDYLKILVPYDFTEASDKAKEQAAKLDERCAIHIDLLHVIDSAKEEEKAMTTLREQSAQLVRKSVSSSVIVQKGAVLETINEVAANGLYHLMVIGTHGPKGLRQSLLGADILKLLKESPCPSIVVQKTSQPIEAFKRILLPVGSHEDYESLAEDVNFLAQISGAEVIIYTINRPGEEPAEELLANKEHTIRLFRAHDVPFREVMEDTSVFSFGFAKQTLLYAEKNDVDLIAIMPNVSAEHSYFANADKERVLVNEKGIAILCSAGNRS